MCHNLNHIFETEQANPVRHNLNTRQLSRPLGAGCSIVEKALLLSGGLWLHCQPNT